MNYTYDKIKTKTITNSEYIRNMTDAKLAWVLMEFRIDSCCKANGGEAALPDTQQTILKWLGATREVRVDDER